MAAFNQQPSQAQQQPFGQFGAINLSGQSQFGGATSVPFGSGSGSGSGTPGGQFSGGIMLPTTPRPGSTGPAASTPMSAPPPAQQQGAKDPFADLAGLF
jgi:hypothetical protein